MAGTANESSKVFYFGWVLVCDIEMPFTFHQCGISSPRKQALIVGYITWVKKVYVCFTTYYVCLGSRQPAL